MRSATMTTSDHAASSTAATTPPLVLRIRPRPHIQWRADVIDNEGAGKKSSKACCVYAPPRAAGESSSDFSESSSDDDDDSDDDAAAGADEDRLGERRSGAGREQRRRRPRSHGRRKNCARCERGDECEPDGAVLRASDVAAERTAASAAPPVAPSRGEDDATPLSSVEQV